MTYKQLAEQLQKIDPKRLDDTVTVHDPYNDEFIAVTDIGFSDDQNDVLDKDHLYLVLKA